MLGDDLAAGLIELRAHAESRMRSRVLIESVAVTADPMTGRDIEVPTKVAELCCRLKGSSSVGEDADVSSASIREVGRRLHVPWDTTGLKVGMRATITASEIPSLVGVVLRLKSPTQGDQTTAQRWEVESWRA